MLVNQVERTLLCRQAAAASLPPAHLRTLRPTRPPGRLCGSSAPRSLLNPPLAGSLEAAIYSATNIVRAHAASGARASAGVPAWRACLRGLLQRACSARAPWGGARAPCLPAAHSTTPPARLCPPTTRLPAVGGLGPERQIPPAILRGCAGLAVLSVARVGLGWSVAAGSGLVVARRPPGGGDGGPGWSAPSAVLSLASSVGWQLGAEVQDLVLVLRDEAALRAFTGSQLGLGGAASVAAGPVGRAAAASARAALGGAGLAYSYGATRGAYAGVALEGTALFPRDAVNQVRGCAVRSC